MSVQRVFKVADHLLPHASEPVRSVVHATHDAAVVAWTVLPGQSIRPHTHPAGQDTWTILEGEGAYQTDGAGHTVPVVAGDVVIAPTGTVHGVRNTGARPLVFVLVVSPAGAGYELA